MQSLRGRVGVRHVHSHCEYACIIIEELLVFEHSAKARLFHMKGTCSLQCRYYIVGNLCGVLIFIIFVVNLAVAKMSTQEKFVTATTMHAHTHIRQIVVVPGLRQAPTMAD